MDAELSLTERGDKIKHIVPIATEEVFSRYWKPLSSDLDLQWVPLFQSGFFVGRLDIPFVLGELKEVRQYLPSWHLDDMPADVREQLTSRVTRLISELEQSQDASEIYIG